MPPTKASVLTGYLLPFLIDYAARGFSIARSEIAQICIFIFQYSVRTVLSFEVGLQFVVGRATFLCADPTDSLREEGCTLYFQVGYQPSRR